MLNPNRTDVELVQKLLNLHRKLPLRAITVDGKQGTETFNAIDEFQRRVVKMPVPDGRADPGGTTFRKLTEGLAPGWTPGLQPLLPSATPYWGPGYFSHPDAVTVVLEYRMQDNGQRVVQLTASATLLLKSILASCGLKKAFLNSTKRTWHDQARITLTQTYPSAGGADKVLKWYGQDVLDQVKKNPNDIQALADWSALSAAS